MHLIRLDFVTFLKAEAAAGGIWRGHLAWRGQIAAKATGISALAMRLPGRARAPVAVHGGGSSGNLATRPAGLAIRMAARQFSLPAPAGTENAYSAFYQLDRTGETVEKGAAGLRAQTTLGRFLAGSPKPQRLLVY